MMKTTAVLLLAVLLAVLAAAAESPRIIWEWNAKDGAPAGAELVRQPGEPAFLRVRGPAAPAFAIDGALLKGKMVTVDGVVRGEKLGRKFGDCLKLIPDYRPFDKYRENWGYRPAPPVAREKSDWERSFGSWRIPPYAGNFKLVLGDAGQEGVADYREIRILEVPAPEAPASGVNRAPLQKTPKYRGAMAGNLKNEEDFRIFAEEWGGNLIRWQFLQGGPAVFPDAESYLKWGRDRIGELRRVLPFFRKYGIKVVIDLHRSPGEMNDINNNLGLWTKERQDAVLRLWREIAAAFNGDPVLYGYDLVNEPIDKVYDVRSDALDWDRFAEKLAREIRSIDPVTPIIVETSYNPRPLNLPNIIYSPHFYEPGEYTHQGIRARSMVGPYPDPAKGWNREWIRLMAEPMRQFQLKYNVPIYVGEFGVIRWAPGGAQWLDDWISVFEEYGWDWSFHAYREWSGWSVEHSDDKNLEQPVSDTARKQVLLKYFKRNTR